MSNFFGHREANGDKKRLGGLQTGLNAACRSCGTVTGSLQAARSVAAFTAKIPQYTRAAWTGGPLNLKREGVIYWGMRGIEYS